MVSLRGQTDQDGKGHSRCLIVVSLLSAHTSFKLPGRYPEVDFLTDDTCLLGASL